MAGDVYLLCSGFNEAGVRRPRGPRGRSSRDGCGTSFNEAGVRRPRGLVQEKGCGEPK